MNDLATMVQGDLPCICSIDDIVLSDVTIVGHLGLVLSWSYEQRLLCF